MNIQNVLETKVKEAVSTLFKAELPSVEFQPTRKDFEGDITIVVFPMLRVVKGNPVQIGNDIGAYLVAQVEEIIGFNVIKGFLNLVISDAYYLADFKTIDANTTFGHVAPDTANAVMVEYSSPNTNKPLHLGHIRNNLLGYSVAEILKASGKKVYKTQIINDRGIHICKSMLAWQKFGKGETPEGAGLKGDKLVGNYYVAFDKAYKEEVATLIANGTAKEVAEKEAPILVEAQQMLLKWEAGDEDVVALWKTMNQWVYAGFEVTYKNLGVDFDTLYYESDTYLLGKDVVAAGLEKGVFFKKEDGSVWIDLTDEGLDEKIVLRSDGTAVYMTQDIGTAIQRVKDHPDVSGMVYTVGNEQDYHFKVLFLILKKLGFSWSENLFHLSYGMVDLPSGKMKSREGTVVDADDLMQDMTTTAGEISQELGKLEDYSADEKQDLYKMIGLGALKYYILKVDPKKRILFNPEESVDFQGNTGPFIQYTYARIQSILRKADELKLNGFDGLKELHAKEKELIKQLQGYPETIQLAAANYSPALVANYTYDLVKEFNSFYQNVSILGEEDAAKKAFRVQLSKKVSDVIQSSFKLLGIEVPQRM
ncbi:arginine--tRNA ligase [Cellulophaga baltica]|jgi:arginyl-tRNA synthetase|uniref:Arginine--tRNA ligase n=1 Tax=Cellulophaga baltica TaxID=76594 RepID=A0A1G7EHB1_9FLAO|nr:arginine--tRNA ligase [Cellulophaga baltica]MBA6314322.1 arginine--tRNA ligase [Cellulophaga baltica]WFO15745.1 arginine--tRNA ligase [Cellulophaga baltica 4]SDE63023.1 arginyl-tRNA synthetase [Cellulophaga baltica]